MPVLAPAELERFSTQLLAAGGVGAEESSLIAKSLVAANLRGHDSHGVMRIPSYIDSRAKGDVVADAPFEVLRETDTVLVADGHWGFGQTQAQRLTERLIAKAGASGTATGTLVNCSHIGRLGEYCERAAQAGLLSMLMVNTHGNARRVAPPGGKSPRLGTNPIAFGVPRDCGPLILDFGTSATAEGKVRVKRIAGQKCPDGWLVDAEGRPTNDPHTLYGNPPGSILPMGGDQAYKGFGLGLMVEIFTGALSGGPCIREVPITQVGNCVFMLLLDPQHFAGADHLRCEVEGLAEFVTGCPRIDGVQEILLPGDPERRTLAKRSKDGIPLDDGNWNELVKLAQRLAVQFPPVQSS
jgi:LDH2 family malate/lactate/ureidoglycolate dehydrogenase